jgi:beta-1,4-mannosyl-glycoprotein beta-1,4-N-acetylglucosaminyltransferase
MYNNKMINTYSNRIKNTTIRYLSNLFSKKNERRKVYDCFTFWKEFDVLEIRLNELFDVVDKFIIIESAYTHSGLKKELYLKNNIGNFSKFKSKILLISDESFNRKQNPNQRENSQRSRIDDGLRYCGAKPGDLILLSDCDEIPRASSVQSLIKKPMNCIFELSGYISYYNLFFQKWYRGRALLYRDFKGAQYARRDYFIESAFNMRRFKFWPFLRINPFFAVGTIDRYFGTWVGIKKRKKIPILRNAGWHFTKMFSDEIVLDSINASSHTEFNSPDINIHYIKNRKATHQVFYGSYQKGKVVKLDHTFPKYLVENKGKFNQFIL